MRQRRPSDDTSPNCRSCRLRTTTAASTTALRARPPPTSSHGRCRFCPRATVPCTLRGCADPVVLGAFVPDRRRHTCISSSASTTAIRASIGPRDPDSSSATPAPAAPRPSSSVRCPCHIASNSISSSAPDAMPKLIGCDSTPARAKPCQPTSLAATASAIRPPTAHACARRVAESCVRPISPRKMMPPRNISSTSMRLHVRSKIRTEAIDMNRRGPKAMNQVRAPTFHSLPSRPPNTM